MSDLFNKLVLRRKGTVLQRGLLPLAKRESTPWYPGCASHSLGNRNRDFPGQCTTVQLGTSLQRMSRGISTSSPAGGTGGSLYVSEHGPRKLPVQKGQQCLF